MDLIYGDNSKKRKIEADLPVHLPNMLPSIPSLPTSISQISTDEDKVIATPTETKQEDGQSQKITKVVPIYGTDITLKTQEDIDEWIEQRKKNWMKRISNNREMPKVEEKTNDEANNNNKKDNKKQKTNKNNRIPNQDNKQRKQFQNDNQNKDGFNRDKFNLNKTLIQRELMDNENKDILDFIKELFDNKII